MHYREHGNVRGPRVFDDEERESGVRRGERGQGPKDDEEPGPARVPGDRADQVLRPEEKQVPQPPLRYRLRLVVAPHDLELQALGSSGRQLVVAPDPVPVQVGREIVERRLPPRITLVQR